MIPSTKISNASEFKTRVIFRIVNITCFGTILCGMCQLFDLFTFSGKDFRPRLITDSTVEEIFLTVFQIVLGVVGIFGVSYKRGPVYFTVYATLVCTLLALHICDALWIFLYAVRRGEGKDCVKFLKFKYRHYDNFITRIKVDRIHRSLQCCGISGPTNKEVRLGTDKLIPSCCPVNVKYCTVKQAYKTGCAKLLVGINPAATVYQVKNVLNLFFEFFTYRITLWAYV